MAESIHEQVIEHLVARFSALKEDGGETVWYTPDRVERTHATELRALLNPGYSTIWILAPGEEVPPEAVGQEVDESYTFNLMLATKHEGSDEPFRADNPGRWTVQTRLARDFKRSLWTDVTCGGLCDNVNIIRIGMTPDETYVAGWAIIVAECQIVSQHGRGAP